MHEKHHLKTLVGLNPNTARKLFQQLSQEFESVSWTDFRRHAGRDLRCFAEDSRWISGDLFRDYFAEFENGAQLGARLMKLYDEKAHKPSFNAYGDGDGSGNGKRGNSKRGNSKRSSSTSPKALKAHAAAIRSEIELLDKLIALRNEVAA